MTPNGGTDTRAAGTREDVLEIDPELFRQWLASPEAEAAFERARTETPDRQGTRPDGPIRLAMEKHRATCGTQVAWLRKAAGAARAEARMSEARHEDLLEHAERQAAAGEDARAAELTGATLALSVRYRDERLAEAEHLKAELSGAEAEWRKVLARIERTNDDRGNERTERGTGPGIARTDERK